MSIREAKSLQAFARQHDPRFIVEAAQSREGAFIRCYRKNSQSSVWYRHALDYALEGTQELGADFKSAILTWRTTQSDQEEMA